MRISIFELEHIFFFSHDADDEFVSESFQGATKKEMAEVNESMRRLGLGGGGGKLTFYNN